MTETRSRAAEDEAGCRCRSTRKATERAVFEDLCALAPIPIAMLRGNQLIIELANEAALSILGGDDVPGSARFQAVVADVLQDECVGFNIEVSGVEIERRFD